MGSAIAPRAPTCGEGSARLGEHLHARHRDRSARTHPQVVFKCASLERPLKLLEQHEGIDETRAALEHWDGRILDVRVAAPGAKVGVDAVPFGAQPDADLVREAAVIRGSLEGHQGVIRGHQGSSEGSQMWISSAKQLSSGVIRGHQGSSGVIGGHQRSSAYLPSAVTSRSRRIGGEGGSQPCGEGSARRGEHLHARQLISGNQRACRMNASKSARIAASPGM